MINSNVWLASQGRRVSVLIRNLEVYRAKGSYGGEINLAEIITLFNGATAEINRLQKLSEAKDVAIKELNKQITEVLESYEKQVREFFEANEGKISLKETNENNI